MKKLIMIVILISIIVCSIAIANTLDHITSDEGVDCVTYQQYEGGIGVSCNWEKYNNPNSTGGETVESVLQKDDQIVQKVAEKKEKKSTGCGKNKESVCACFINTIKP